MRAVSRRPLGQTGVAVSALGLGCASYWASPAFSEARAAAVFEQALALDINLFDTGASYARGLAERRLGRLLRRAGNRSNELIVATKIGTFAGAGGRLQRDFRPASLADQLTASVRRLGLERVGLLQLHGPGPGELTDELFAMLERERDNGRARLLGINAHSPETIRQAIDSGLFDVVMPFVSVMRPEGRALSRRAAAAGVGVLAAEPLGRMRFAPPLRRWLTRRSGLWYLARLAGAGPGAITEARRLRRALRAPGWTPAQLALRWVLDQPGVSAAVVGTTRPEHLRELAQAEARALPKPVAAALDSLLPPA